MQSGPLFAIKMIPSSLYCIDSWLARRGPPGEEIYRLRFAFPIKIQIVHLLFGDGFVFKIAYILGGPMSCTAGPSRDTPRDPCREGFSFQINQLHTRYFSCRRSLARFSPTRSPMSLVSYLQLLQTMCVSDSLGFTDFFEFPWKNSPTQSDVFSFSLSFLPWPSISFLIFRIRSLIDCLTLCYTYHFLIFNFHFPSF